jgi:hypothetical protein
MNKRTERLQASCTPDLLDKLHAIRRRDDCRLSDVIERACAEYVKQEEFAAWKQSDARTSAARNERSLSRSPAANDGAAFPFTVTGFAN